MVTAEFAANRRGSSGGVIAPHRTLITIPLSWVDVVAAAALTIVFTVFAFVAAPVVFDLWRWIFTHGSDALGLGPAARLVEVPTAILSGTVPALSVPAPAPGLLALGLSLVAIVALEIVARAVATRALPLAYALRAIAIVLASSVLVFALGARPPSLELGEFARTMIKVSAGIWLFVPLGYGLTLFLLDISWPRKAALIAMAMTHLALFIPVQQLVMLYLVQHLTLVIVPLWFVFGSVIPLIAVLIALYSWGASWPGRVE
jgi:hypothetical protein